MKMLELRAGSLLLQKCRKVKCGARKFLSRYKCTWLLLSFYVFNNSDVQTKRNKNSPSTLLRATAIIKPQRVITLQPPAHEARALAGTRISSWARARRERGGAARSQRRLGWESCPGYLPNSTWLLWRAPARAPTADAMRTVTRVWTPRYTFHFLCFRGFLFLSHLVFPKLLGAANARSARLRAASSAGAGGKFSRESSSFLGVAGEKVQVVNRFLVPAWGSKYSGITAEFTIDGLGESQVQNTGLNTESGPERSLFMCVWVCLVYQPNRGDLSPTFCASCIYSIVLIFSQHSHGCNRKKKKCDKPS